MISGSYEQLYAKQVLHSTDSFKNTDSFMNIIIVWICLENDAIVCLHLYLAEQKQRRYLAIFYQKYKLININNLFTKMLNMRISTLTIKIQLDCVYLRPVV